MQIQAARGLCFRNYDHFFLNFSSAINIFYGENGQGKSSLLEALYCGLRGRSFYPFIQFQFVQYKKNKAQVFLDFEEQHGFSDISAEFCFLGEKSLKKSIKYCGKKVSSSFLSKKFPCIVFTEESMKCLRLGSDQRRYFIDNLLEKEESINLRRNFERVLLEKRSLLKKFKQNQISSQSASELLDSLNPIFLKLSLKLVEKRLNLLDSLFSNLKTVGKEFFQDEQPSLSFEYLFSKERIVERSQWGQFMEEELRRKRSLELQFGLPLCGPQKHEIKFLYNGQDSRFFCSKGQQRLFLLSLLASYLQKDSFFLFLDDVLLELDEKSQNCFLKFIEKNHCQTFLTSCNLINFRTEKTSSFFVKSGRIEKI